MPRPDTREALKAYATAKGNRDLDAAMAMCHRDVTYESVALPGVIKGWDAVRAYYGALFEGLPDYYGDFDGEVVEGDAAVVWGRFGGTVHGQLFGIEADGRRLEVPVAFVCIFKEGLLIRELGYFDRETLRRQLGLATGRAADEAARSAAPA
jgi:steroid delta-isomerase-like uncharacterized protein